ncbi:CRTAC1 family protein [Lutimonas halocynthiae]|uniref:CRTAC1 family protein n=1 Tax=Lutimonas halocynthiae TaxID=1446477 RepID=UPI0025B33D58|nr:CRTAC1 family protein [Lutimonas halocynthiae]MDN3642058.1 CRTAC1 family protein [Lutimonas halocynthiae]
MKQSYQKQSLYISDIIKKVFVYLLILILFNFCNSEDKKQLPKTEHKIENPDANEEYFQEIAADIGLDFVHSIGAAEMENIIESVGGGAAFLDFDQDGFMDIYTCSGTWVEGFSKTKPPVSDHYNRLYRNLTDGTFQEVSIKAGVAGPWYSMGITVGDVNNDGYPDIYLSNYGDNTLYLNKGDGTFEDITEQAGVGGGTNCSVGAVWLDFDNDGLLDLYVGNYLNYDPDYSYYYAPDGFPGPLAYDSQKDILYKNLGNNKFEDVTTPMGIIDIDGRAMGVGAADYDDDGFVDIYVANDHTANFLWHNDGGKGFTDMGTLSGTGFSQAGEATVSMSVDFADYNHDELLDIFISDDNYCSLYENIGNGVFKDNSYASGISMASGQFVGWSSSFLDYDNDGNPDIFKANGELKHLYGQEDQMFKNVGEGKFNDTSLDLSAYFREEHVGRGACIGDYDNDGDLDIYIVNLNGSGKFLRNNKGNASNWIILDLAGTKSNRDAIGCRIKIVSDSAVQTSQKKSTTGYLSQNDSRIHFGLGESNIVDQIEIRWPSGTHQVLKQVPSNQILKITEPK